MVRRLATCLLSGALALCLLVAGSQPTLATVVFDDHFTGNSDGIPANWWGLGVIVESGTTVTLHDEAGMATTSTIDPQTGTVTVTVDVVGTNKSAMAGLADDGTLQNKFEFKITVPDGDVYAFARDTESGWQEYMAGHVTGYAGGSIRLTAVLTATTFTISTDSPAFSTGPIEYDAAFSTFVRAALSNAAVIALMSDALDGGPSFATYDRITVDIVPAVAVESLSFGQIKALYGR